MECFGLAVVAFIFWLLAEDHVRLADEMPMLLRSTAIFVVLAATAAAALFGVLKSLPWRFPVLGLLWAGLLAAGWYYWP